MIVDNFSRVVYLNLSIEIWWIQRECSKLPTVKSGLRLDRGAVLFVFNLRQNSILPLLSRPTTRIGRIEPNDPEARQFCVNLPGESHFRRLSWTFRNVRACVGSVVQLLPLNLPPTPSPATP